MNDRSALRDRLLSVLLRVAVHAYPAVFREQFADDLIVTFWRRARSHGNRVAFWRFVGQSLFDVAFSGLAVRLDHQRREDLKRRRASRSVTWRRPRSMAAMRLDLRYAVSAADPLVLSVTIATLLVVASLAASIPACRALLVDPVEVLRQA